MVTRREFLRTSGIALSASALLPSFLGRVAWAAREGVASRYGQDTILVVIQMGGGNDGLNTVIPYGIDGYRQARSAMGIAESDVLPLTGQVGLHPEMGRLHDLYQAGQVAIVQGVGYENPNLSHFRATDIWLTAAPDTYETSGWLADYLAWTTEDDGNPTYAISVTQGLSRALYGNGIAVPSIASLQAYQFRTDPRYQNDRQARLDYANWVYGLDYSRRPFEQHVARTAATAMASSQRVQDAASAYAGGVEYPAFGLANDLKTVAQLIAGGLGTRVFYVSFGGFDTHSNQPDAHARLLGGFSNSVYAFLQDVAQMGKSDQVMLMTWSEFGRRVSENGSRGTDHGTAGPMIVVGPRVAGGLYGDHPSLTDLDRGNLKYGVDFRSVYGTAMGWLGADQQAVLGATYESVGFV